MMQVSKTISRVIFIIGAATGALVINLFFLDKLIIPDPCYYHTNEGGSIFRLFYDLPADEGYHPVPGIFNIVFTAVLGGLAGFVLSHLIIRKQKTKSA